MRRSLVFAVVIVIAAAAIALAMAYRFKARPWDNPSAVVAARFAQPADDLPQHFAGLGGERMALGDEQASRMPAVTVGDVPGVATPERLARLARNRRPRCARRALTAVASRASSGPVPSKATVPFARVGCSRTNSAAGEAWIARVGE